VLISKENINVQLTITRNDDIIFSEMGDEIVMMSIDKGEYYGLDPVGKRIWELLEKPEPVSTVCDTLYREYDVAPDKCKQDVLVFLDQLFEKEIIKVVPD
jgi:hypothetical protein